MPNILFPIPPKKGKALVNRDIKKLPSPIESDIKSLRQFTTPNTISTCLHISIEHHTMTTNITNITNITRIIITITIILTISMCNNMSIC